MARRNKKHKSFENVEITGIGSDGRSVAKIEGEAVIFVEKTVPGDIVDIQVTKKKSSYYLAYPTKYHKYSEDRTEPVCEYFGTCGGCKWQHLPYDKQLAYKQQQVEDALKRIAQVPYPELKPILPSAKTTYYRNKLEFSFTAKRWLTKEEIDKQDSNLERRGTGFHIPGRFDKVLDIDKCHLQSDLSNQIRNSVRDFARQKDLTFYDFIEETGLLRNLIIRTSITGETMVIVQFYEGGSEEVQMVMDHIKESFPALTSLLYIINPKKNDTFYDQEVVTWYGRDYIEEEMEGLKFRVGPKSFYQTNSDQAYELYKIARDFAELSGEEVVYDLYTGTGTIAQFVASNASKVIGIESVEMAVEDAKENAKLNSIDHLAFFAGDIRDLLKPAFFDKHGKADLIITDPPRPGMHPDVVKTLLAVKAPKIVYISCNPATQARDLKVLGAKYDVKAVQPVDMFPHTLHVENVVLLHLKEDLS